MEARVWREPSAGGGCTARSSACVDGSPASLAAQVISDSMSMPNGYE